LDRGAGDLPVVALATWKEACGEGELGMKAVMDVIFNRAKDWNKSLTILFTLAISLRA